MKASPVNQPYTAPQSVDKTLNSEKIPNNWLVYRLSSLGDVALISGVLQFWHVNHGLRFNVYTKAPYHELFYNHPAVQESIGVNKAELTFPKIFTTFRQLNKQFSGCGLLDLHSSLRSHLLGMLWQGPVARYDKMSVQRRLYLHNKNKTAQAELEALNVTQRYAAALLPLLEPATSTGLQALNQQALRPQIFLTEAEHAQATTRIAQIFPVHSTYAAPAANIHDSMPASVQADELSSEHGGIQPIALHPYATHSRKEWPAKYWHALADMLDKAEIKWIAVGQGKALFPKRINDLSNQTSLRALCALLAQCSLLISGDSGPMHLASAVGTPVLGLFGPTTRAWGFYPAGADDIVLELNLPCRPCSLHGDVRCEKDGQCLRDLTPKMVFEHIKRASHDYTLSA